MLLPLVLSITFALTELGRAFYQYNSLLKATRDAARARSLGGDKDEAKCLAVYAKPAPCSSQDDALIDGLTLDLIDVAEPEAIGSISLVRVSVTGFRFVSLIPFVIPDFGFTQMSTVMRLVSP